MLLVSLVHVEAVAKGDGFACGDCQVACAFGFFLEIVYAERAVDQSRVVAPRCSLPSAIAVANASALGYVTSGFAAIEFVRFQSHAFG